MSGHNTGAVLEGRVTSRGSSNGNARGSSTSRRRRREWLVNTWRADAPVVRVTYLDPGVCSIEYPTRGHWEVATVIEDARRDASLADGADAIADIVVLPACRCFRCGRLLSVHTVTADRIVPGCQGGTYRRDNIRPACGVCNSFTGGGVRS